MDRRTALKTIAASAMVSQIAFRSTNQLQAQHIIDKKDRPLSRKETLDRFEQFCVECMLFRSPLHKSKYIKIDSFTPTQRQVAFFLLGYNDDVLFEDCRNVFQNHPRQEGVTSILSAYHHAFLRGVVPSFDTQLIYLNGFDNVFSLIDQTILNYKFIDGLGRHFDRDEKYVNKFTPSHNPNVFDTYQNVIKNRCLSLKQNKKYHIICDNVKYADKHYIDTLTNIKKLYSASDVRVSCFNTVEDRNHITIFTGTQDNGVNVRVETSNFIML